MKQRLSLFSALVISARDFLKRNKPEEYQHFNSVSKRMAWKKWKETTGIKPFGNFRPVKPFRYNGKSIP